MNNFVLIMNMNMPKLMTDCQALEIDSIWALARTVGVDYIWATASVGVDEIWALEKKVCKKRK
jgi:hypothetical protein